MIMPSVRVYCIQGYVYIPFRLTANRPLWPFPGRYTGTRAWKRVTASCGPRFAPRRAGNGIPEQASRSVTSALFFHLCSGRGCGYRSAPRLPNPGLGDGFLVLKSEADLELPARDHLRIRREVLDAGLAREWSVSSRVLRDATRVSRRRAWCLGRLDRRWPLRHRASLATHRHRRHFAPTP